jgi:glycosyltransferase involved in cell wall biosynthesis
MGRDMPAPVTYWTGIWDPQKEALSREVETLRTAISPRSPVVSFSHGQSSRWWPRDGVIRLSGRRWLSLRALGTIVEPFGTVTHILGDIGSWHLLKAVGRRPILYTAAIDGPLIEKSLFNKVSLFVAETEHLAERLISAGIERRQLRVVYPGVDLQIFRPAPLPPDRPFRILFASSPANPAEFTARGIPLLLEAARRCPDVHVTLLWRQWGRVDDARRAFAALNPPSNVEIDHRARDVGDMVAAYQNAHVTACLYAEGFGKSCPQSVIESLACGRPVLVTESSGLADLVRRRKVGAAAPATPEGVVTAIHQLRTSLARCSTSALHLARERFDVDVFVTRYRELYAELGAEIVAPVAADRLSA